MSKIIEKFLIPLFVVISALYAFNSFGHTAVQLNKVYHHMTQNPMLLEKANVSFYFSGDPHLQEIKNNRSFGSTSCAFFFPKATISSGECEAMVKQANAYNDGYTMSIEEVEKPVKGIMVIFSFDQQKLALTYEWYDSIGLQKGIVFRLYNKDVLAQLERVNNKAVLQTLMHQKPCIVIDSGHGGKDAGAVGCGGVTEKQVCLAIGLAVGNLLEQHGYDVVLTRNSDCTVALEERTFCANQHNADLLVSIHANYATNPRASGIETFCSKPSLLKQHFSQLSDKEHDCIASLMKQRADCAYKVAQSIQHNACYAAAQCNNELVDRKVKYSVSQILLSSQMPTVLIEVGFVSNPHEALLLNDAQYQDQLAHGIYRGIVSARSF
jgi:N-acetylmuramoyl-L-alanine amidase